MVVKTFADVMVIGVPQTWLFREQARSACATSSGREAPRWHQTSITSVVCQGTTCVSWCDMIVNQAWGLLSCRPTEVVQVSIGNSKRLGQAEFRTEGRCSTYPTFLPAMERSWRFVP